MQEERLFRDGTQLFLLSEAIFAEMAIRKGREPREDVQKILHEELDRALAIASAFSEERFDLETTRINLFVDAMQAIVEGKMAEKIKAEDEKGDDFDGCYS